MFDYCNIDFDVRICLQHQLNRCQVSHLCYSPLRLKIAWSWVMAQINRKQCFFLLYQSRLGFQRKYNCNRSDANADLSLAFAGQNQPRQKSWCLTGWWCFVYLRLWIPLKIFRGFVLVLKLRDFIQPSFFKKPSYLFIKLMLIAHAGECSVMNSVACLCIMSEAIYRTNYCQKICFAFHTI